MNADTARIQEIRERLKAATPASGGWHPAVWCEADGDGWVAIGPHHEWTDEDNNGDNSPGCEAEQAAQRDAQLIAHAPSDLELLLAKLAASEARETRLREVMCSVLGILRKGDGTSTECDAAYTLDDALNAEPPPPNPGNEASDAG